MHNSVWNSAPSLQYHFIFIDINSSKGIAFRWSFNNPFQSQMMNSMRVQAIATVMQVPCEKADHAPMGVYDRKGIFIIPG